MKRKHLFTMIVSILCFGVLLVGCENGKQSSSTEKKNQEASASNASPSEVETKQSEVSAEDVNAPSPLALGNSDRIKIKFSTSPSTLLLNKKSTLAVNVTGDGKPLKDAKVKFEIWKDVNQDNSILVDTKNDQKGKYYLAGEFSEAGNYYLIAHVDALGVHAMNTFQFAIQ